MRNTDVLRDTERGLFMKTEARSPLMSSVARPAMMIAAVATSLAFAAPGFAQATVAGPSAASPDTQTQSAGELPAARSEIPATAGTGASASTSAEVGVGDIVVTAQRRSENLQKVPIAVTAVDATTLQRANVSNISELNILAPSLNFLAEGAWSQPTLRGIGTAATGPGIENAVATYIDGVYQAAMIGGASDFNSVKAVEVINGPQGTLFGRNATGGLIQIRTVDPSHDFHGSLAAGYGNYQTVSASGYVTGGLTSTLAADLAVDFGDQANGYRRDILLKQDIQKNQKLFVRSKLLFTPSEDVRFTLAGNYGRVEFDPRFFNYPGSIPLGGLYPGVDKRHAASPYRSRGLVKQYGATLTGEIDLHPLKLLSITAYQHTDATNVFGTTLTNPLTTRNLILIEPHRQFSQGFQLSSPSSGKFTWTAGIYYFHEKSGYDPVRLYGPLYSLDPNPMNQATDIFYNTVNKTDSYAAYVQGTYHIGSATRLTGGFRYTYEKRRISIDSSIFVPTPGGPFGPIPTASIRDGKTFKAPSWRISLDHDFAPRILGYVSYNRGFKSGGFNPAQTFNAPNGVSYQPEKLDAYEVGLKTQTNDRRLRLNLAAFLYNYSNIQVESFANQILFISNGAKARLYGLDIDADAAVTQNFSVHAGASLLHATFTKYPNADITTPVPYDPVTAPFGGGNSYSTGSAKGNRVPRAPKAILTVAANYTIPTNSGKFNLNANYNYNSGWNAEADGRLKQKSYSLLGAQISWTAPSGNYELTAWGKNLLDTDYAETIFSQSAYDEIHWAPPRTYGVSGKVKF